VLCARGFAVGLLHPEHRAADRGRILPGLEVERRELGNQFIRQGSSAGVCREGEGGFLGRDAGVSVAVEGGLKKKKKRFGRRRRRRRLRLRLSFVRSFVRSSVGD